MTIAEQITQLKTDFDDVYEAGKQAEYDAFWDNFQIYPNGTERNDYYYAFYYWADPFYNPKHRIIIKFRGGYAFSFAAMESTKVPIYIATTNCSYMFMSCCIKTIPDIAIIVSTTSSVFNQLFTNAIYLENITFTYEISVSINFQWCPLSNDSLANIIEMLHDFVADGSGSTRKLTLGSTNIAKLTAEQLDVIEQKGWTYA